eukprot:2805104-Rhodomonas_salina.1
MGAGVGSDPCRRPRTGAGQVTSSISHYKLYPLCHVPYILLPWFVSRTARLCHIPYPLLSCYVTSWISYYPAVSRPVSATALLYRTGARQATSCISYCPCYITPPFSNRPALFCPLSAYGPARPCAVLR